MDAQRLLQGVIAVDVDGLDPDRLKVVGSPLEHRPQAQPRPVTGLVAHPGDRHAVNLLAVQQPSDLLGQRAWRDGAQHRAVEIVEAVVHQPCCHALAQRRDRLGGEHLDEPACQPRRAHTTCLEERAGHHTCRDGVVSDVPGVTGHRIAGCQRLRRRPERRQDLQPRPEPVGRGIQHPVGALGIVPATGEAPPFGVLPRDQPPWIGRNPYPERLGWPRGGRQAAVGSQAHAPALNARAAASSWGPTSSRSPSRSSRAGLRSSSCGLSPCHQAWATSGASRAVSMAVIR